MSLYGQDPELDLLKVLLPLLDCRTVIDVGAERGSIAAGLLASGAELVHVFDAHPDNVAALIDRFGDDPRVAVHACAVSDLDGTATLHEAVAPDGSTLTFGHTLLLRSDTTEIRWVGAMTVATRSLASLAAAMDIPSRVGILKVDTEGHDLAVITGMGSLECDIVMVEHWTDLPQGLGPCPWRIDDLLARLQPRGFSHFAFIVHRGEFVSLSWDDGQVEHGAMGNLLFVHDRVLEQVSPALLTCASRLANDVVAVGRRYMTAATERLAALIQTTHAADERLVALEAVNAELVALRGDRSG